MENHSNINNMFVPYELALKLKELGFDEECLGSFTINDCSLQIDDMYSLPSIVKAPLWQQAFDFILNKFDLVGTVYANASGYLYEIHDSATKGGTHRAESGYDGDCEYSGTYTTYHKGRLACLEKLIELVENEKN